MQFITDHDYYKAAKIFGSFHNLLSIKLSETAPPIKVIGISSNLQSQWSSFLVRNEIEFNDMLFLKTEGTPNAYNQP